jgi:hypothetical protein
VKVPLLECQYRLHLHQPIQVWFAYHLRQHDACINLILTLDAQGPDCDMMVTATYANTFNFHDSSKCPDTNVGAVVFSIPISGMAFSSSDVTVLTITLHIKSMRTPFLSMLHKQHLQKLAPASNLIPLMPARWQRVRVPKIRVQPPSDHQRCALAMHLLPGI